MNYRHSFSGADFSNVAWFNYYDKDNNAVSSSPVELETLGTISISVNEQKGDVRALGNRSVRGFTSAIRSIGGTLVFNIINDNPFNSLVKEYLRLGRLDNPWVYTTDLETNYRSEDFSKGGLSYLPTALPPFNILLTGSTELNLAQFSTQDSNNHFEVSFSNIGIYGIELISESLVISVNNILTEVAFQFKARDYSQLTSYNLDKIYDDAMRKSEQDLLRYNSYDKIEITDTMNQLTRMKSPDTLVTPRSKFESGLA